MNDTILKTDLALTRDVGTPSGLALTTADSWGSLDCSVPVNDLGVVSGRANLAQALTLRLLTPLGALAPLGHPAYGSQLVSLIGRRNDQTARNLAKLYTIQSVKQEPRVAELTALTVTSGAPDVITIALTVLPLHDTDPLSLVVDVRI